VSIPFGLAALDLLFPLIGVAFLSLIGVAASLGAGMRLLGLAYLTGWALLGVTLSLGLTVGLPLNVPIVVLVAATLVLACSAAASRRWFVPLERRPLVAIWRFDRWISRIGAIILCAAGVALLAGAVTEPWSVTSNFDAFFFWLPKADSIYVSHGLDPTLWRQFRHMEYPPLFPAMNAATFAFTGGFHPSLIPFQQALLSLAFVLAIVALLDRVAPRWLSVPVLAMLATAPWFWVRATSLMPDQTLAYVMAVAALTCVLWLLDSRPSWVALGALFLAAGTLTKLEGWLSAFFLAAVVIVTSLVQFRWRGIRAAWLLLGPGTIVVWWIWLHANGLRGSSPDYALSSVFDPSFLDHQASRLGYSASAMTVTAGHMLATATPFGPIELTSRADAWAFAAALVVLLVFAARSSAAVTAAVACWLVLALAGLEIVYWIGRIPVKVYVWDTVDRVEETPVILTLTLLPLLLALALRLVPIREPDCVGPLHGEE
jgi:hypothetical protein